MATPYELFDWQVRCLDLAVLCRAGDISLAIIEDLLCCDCLGRIKLIIMIGG